MKNILLNRFVLIVTVFYMVIIPLVFNDIEQQTAFYVKNKDNIATCTATVHIEENLNIAGDERHLYKYTVSLSYNYEGKDYFCDHWKFFDQNRVNNIPYHEDQVIEIAFLRDNPEDVFTDSPKDIQELIGSKDINVKENVLLWVLSTLFIYSLSIFICSIIKYGKTLRSNIGNIKYILICALFLTIPIAVGFIGKYFIL